MLISTASSTQQRTTTGLTRVRAHQRRCGREDMYGRVTTYTSMVPDAQGSSLTSRLSDGRHAPVIDIDMPVTVRSHPQGTAVSVSGTFERARVRLALHGLIDNHLASPVSLDMLVRAEQERPNDWWLHEVTVVLPFPALAIASKTPGHFHLLVQHAMSWNLARFMVRTLAAAGIADPDFARISDDGDYMYVNCPPGRYDTI